MKRRIISISVWVVLGLVVLTVFTLVILGSQAMRTPSTGQMGLLFDSSNGALVEERENRPSGSVITNEATLGETILGASEDREALACPITLPEPHGLVSYRRGTNIETWSLQAEASCQEYAKGLLYSLYDAGTNLIEAGYLDLFGSVWGCVAQSEATGVLIITIESKRSDSGSSLYSRPSLSQSPYEFCEVTIIRTFIPEMT